MNAVEKTINCIHNDDLTIKKFYLNRRSSDQTFLALFSHLITNYQPNILKLR